MKKYYLAYGSNLNIRQMSWRCFDASVIGTTTLSGYRLAYKGTGDGSSYLTIEESKDHYVPLGVYEISLEDEKNLDIYEGELLSLLGVKINRNMNKLCIFMQDCDSR